MKKFIYISAAVSSLFAASVFGQTANDMLLLSQNYAGGTARAAGMSGAFGALGGDISVLNTNPAGMAIYRGGEFTITPSMLYFKTSADYHGNTFSDKYSNFAFKNIGYVFTKNLYNDRGYQSIHFGLSFNRLSEFGSETFLENSNSSSSLLDGFVYYANDEYLFNPSGHVLGDDLEPSYEQLAWDAYAIDFDDVNNKYYSNYDVNGKYGQPLYRSMKTRGGINEYAFAFGANYDNKLYLGATLGIQQISYKESYYHEENPEFELSFFDFRSMYSLTGWGINFKAGLIYRPVQALRLGLAIHTPTNFWTSPLLITSMNTYWNISPVTDDKDPNKGQKIFNSPEAEKTPDYRCIIKSPWRYNFSAATILGKLAVIDVDLEIINYAGAKMTPKQDPYIDYYDDEMYRAQEYCDAENEEISEIAKVSTNLKVGAEFRLGAFYLRGGGAMYGNPYNKKAFNEAIRNTFKPTMNYSTGIGFRKRDFYVDAAYSFLKYPKRVTDIYRIDAVRYEQASLQTSQKNVILTFGFRF